MEYIERIIETTAQSFDFTYCICVNILTYVAISAIEDCVGKKLSTWLKRLVTIGAVIIVGIVYYLNGIDNKLLFNSAILAPVFWSWIGKPLVKRFTRNINKED